MSIPKVFISYSHDSFNHKQWVLFLASRLRSNGIDAILDQFELKPGDDIPLFVETNLAEANNILMICTENYVNKANKGEGGVGYEKMIITSNLLKKIGENKVIPIVRQSNTTEVPIFLKTKLYIDFSSDDIFETSYDDLVRSIHRSPIFEKPQIGHNPFFILEKEKLNGDIALLNSVLACIAKCQGLGTYATSSVICSELKITSGLFKVIVLKVIDLKYAEWEHFPVRVQMTKRGYDYLFDNNIKL